MNTDQLQAWLHNSQVFTDSICAAIACSVPSLEGTEIRSDQISLTLTAVHNRGIELKEFYDMYQADGMCSS